VDTSGNGRDANVVTEPLGTRSGALTDVNSFEQPNKIAPGTTAVSGLGNRFGYDLAPNSLTFIRQHP
jgi:hypothetical protein